MFFTDVEAPCVLILPQVSTQFEFESGTTTTVAEQKQMIASWYEGMGISPLMVYMDRFLIGSVISVAAVAFYATPYEVITKMWLVPGALLGVLLVVLATHNMDWASLEGETADLRPGTRYDRVVSALGGHGEHVAEPQPVGLPLRFLQPQPEQLFCASAAWTHHDALAQRGVGVCATTDHHMQTREVLAQASRSRSTAPDLSEVLFHSCGCCDLERE
jgi:hypothetical protein